VATFVQPIRAKPFAVWRSAHEAGVGEAGSYSPVFRAGVTGGPSWAGAGS
jgi:hypothetical protein